MKIVNEEMKKMSHFNFINMMHDLAHPIDDPTTEYAYLMDEAARRIEELEAQVLAWESSADMVGVESPDKLIDYLIACGSC